MSFHWISKRPITAALAFALAGGLGGITVAAASRMDNANPPASLRFANPDEPPSHNSFAPVVKKVLPAVVNISSSKMIKTSAMEGPEMDPMFRQFFGRDFQMPRQPSQQRERRSEERR